MSLTTSPYDDVQFPPFSSLPFRKGDPTGAIWGFYESLVTGGSPTDEEQPLDELGSLNLLTPNRILRASREEIQLGRVVSLNWPLQKPAPAGYQRHTFEHKIVKWPGKTILDDEIRQFYNDLSWNEIVDDMNVPLSVDKPLRNGIHKFQGRIVGRGVFLDYLSYAQSKGITFAPEKQYLVTAEELESCAKLQGDILFIRMGYVSWYNNATPEQRAEAVSGLTKAVGVRQTQAEVEWLWLVQTLRLHPFMIIKQSKRNHHFAAVASDTPAFEARPSIQEWNLHDYLLALWGTPMGELFDLEELSKTCKELNRYSFFITSSPLNIVNGIASPPK
ncbi:hypothetical protein Clacol_010606 [Clathrus columnatus]|uniref:Uncharacterized protein n=1 Tax=Clathrus columnatus TaxID=1419009 RepID=A0AAV5AT23_9AGAM|nr:hypothetical protein Clacol_010606 [Clathrus columnatus]